MKWSEFSDLKILVIGDTIIDQYTYLKVQGLTSKNRIISGRYLRQETHLGGALAAMRHVRQFCDNVGFISLLGEEPWVNELLKEALAPKEDLTIRDPAFTTVVKKRYVEPLQGGNEMIEALLGEFRRRRSAAVGHAGAGAGSHPRAHPQRRRGAAARFRPRADAAGDSRMRAGGGAVPGGELPDQQQQPRL